MTARLMAAAVVVVGVMGSGSLVAAGTSVAAPGTANTLRREAAPTVVRPGTLPHTHKAAQVPWMIDNVVHMSNGRTVTMPWTRSGARNHHLRLLGKTPAGWLVKSFDGGDRWKLWTVRRGKRTLVTSSSVSEGDIVDFRLARSHHRFIAYYFDGDDSTTLSVRTLANAELDSQSFDGIGDILDFSGPRAVVSSENTQRWTVATKTLDPLGLDAAGADLRHDLLFVTDGTSGESGPTSLDSPGAPAWTAPMAQPVVTQGGGRVVSRDSRGGDLLTMRNVETGAALASFDVRYLSSESPVWESSNRSFVFIAYIGGLSDREALVRCRLSGACERISRITPRDTISLPPV